jgi:hypothetical protein
LDLTLNAALAEAAWYENSVIARQESLRTVLFDVAALNTPDPDLSPMLNTCVINRLVNRLISVFMFRILSNNGNADFMLRCS